MSRLRRARALSSVSSRKRNHEPVILVAVSSEKVAPALTVSEAGLVGGSEGSEGGVKSSQAGVSGLSPGERGWEGGREGLTDPPDVVADGSVLKVNRTN